MRASDVKAVAKTPRDWSTADWDAAVREVAAAHRAERGALLPILHELNETYGFVDQSAISVLADELNISRAEVHGVISFYHDFRTESPPVHTLRVCRAEACQSVGADDLVEHARTTLGVEIGGRTSDGRLGVEQVFCFGNCALGPAVEYDGTLHGRVDAARLDELVTETPTPETPTPETPTPETLTPGMPADGGAR